jgi:hypothetical protein
VGGVARWRRSRGGDTNGELVVELHRTSAALSLLAGGNCPLQMRSRLHGVARSGSFLRVGYLLSHVAYRWVLQMQIRELLEKV